MRAVVAGATLMALLPLAVPSPAGAERAGTALSADRSDLSDYRWSHRPVLLFAPSAQDPDYAAQVSMLNAAQAGLADRDIVVLTDTDPDAGGALRARFAPDGFLLLLVGKDGGVKRTESAPIPAESLFSTIDAMPMRRREMSQ